MCSLSPNVLKARNRVSSVSGILDNPARGPTNGMQAAQSTVDPLSIAPSEYFINTDTRTYTEFLIKRSLQRHQNIHTLNPWDVLYT